MTVERLDALLHEALSQSANRQAAALTAAVADLPEHRFSRRYERRISRLLRKPLQYARPVYQQTSRRTAAAILLALGLTGTITLSFPQARAAVWKFIRTVYETHTEYRFTEPVSDTPASLPIHQANWLPDGYEQSSVLDMDDTVWIEYQNGESTIRFSYCLATQGFVYSIDNEHTTEETVTFHGSTYTAFHNEETQWCSLIWFSEDKTIFYHLDGFCPIEDLLNIAENII